MTYRFKTKEELGGQPLPNHLAVIVKGVGELELIDKYQNPDVMEPFLAGLRTIKVNDIWALNRKWVTKKPLPNRIDSEVLQAIDKLKSDLSDFEAALGVFPLTPMEQTVEFFGEHLYRLCDLYQLVSLRDNRIISPPVFVLEAYGEDKVLLEEIPLDSESPFDAAYFETHEGDPIRATIYVECEDGRAFTMQIVER